MVHWPGCGAVLLLLGAASAPSTGHTQTAVQLPSRDRVRLVEAMRLADELRADLWPGWERTPLPVLLVTDSIEYLLGHPRPAPEFERHSYDGLLKRDVWARPPRLSPTLLATFPAVGALPTIVIGSAERTGKSSTAWVLTLLHEHFHQWQYSQPDYYAGVARLGLANGDTTGQWMLDYPFPYDSAPVQKALRTLSIALAGALDSPPATRTEALKAAITAREALRRSLPAAAYRYLEFQLWQEGVARFIEYTAAGAASRLGEPPAPFRGLPDYTPYDAAADLARRGLGRELELLDLGRQRRVAFYPLGAAIALLLEETRPDWRRAYADRPFTLLALLPDSQ